MSDGHWETVRGGHRDPQGDSDSEPDAAVAGRAGPRVRQSSEIIVGWRVWALAAPAAAGGRTDAAPRLLSTFMNDAWQPGTVMKACCGANVLRHGIHAFAEPLQAVAYMDEARKPLRHVYGQVSLWGRVVVHERGYRAEFAYPRRIFVPPLYRGSRDIVNDLRRTYGVETEWGP